MATAMRAGAPADAAAIARVHTLGWQQGHAGMLPADWLAGRVISPEVWAERIAAPLPRSTLTVAEVDGEVVGFSVVGPAEADQPSGVGQLLSLYLLAEHWGQGIGHALHQAGIDALGRHGYSSAILWVLASNAGTIAFYQAHGWVDDVELADRDLGGVVAPLRRFRHDLGAGPGSAVGRGGAGG